MAISPEDQKSDTFHKTKMALEHALQSFADAAVADNRTVSEELRESIVDVFGEDGEVIIEEM